MTWANFYLFCFWFGFLWSFASLLIGHFNLHLPFGHGDAGGHDLDLAHYGGGMNHGHAGHAAHGHATHSGGDAHDAGVSERAPAMSVSPINFGTIAAFLAWFGGAGYLLTNYCKIWFVFSLGLSILAGLAGASIIYWFLAKVLVGNERPLDPADYEMTGVLGRISSPIREGGTGEIIYSQEGTRRTCGARSDDGRAIPKGTEVLVTRYEKGIAYVRLWDELSSSDSPDALFQNDEPPAGSERSK
jgi:membrane protein implicated in regulation of membrane protease activity